MGKIIIITTGGLTLVVLASLGFWFLLPRSEPVQEPVREESALENAILHRSLGLDQHNQGEGPLVEEAAAKFDEKQRRAEQLKALAEALAKEERVADNERKAQAPTITASPPPPRAVPTSPADNERRGTAQGCHNDTKDTQEARQARARLP